MENTNCETCAGDGAVITYNTKDNRLEVQRCDECASFDTDQEAWEALKLREGHRRKRASAKAMVRKLPDRGAWTKYNASLIVGLDYDPCIGRMFHVERNLVW